MCIRDSYPVDHHHDSHPDKENLPKLAFYPIPSYSLPIGSIISKKNPNFLVAEKSISVSNLVNGTTRLQPVVLQIGQVAGLIASESVKKNITTHQIDVRAIQEKYLDKGGYIQPYLDVKKDHPFFKAFQRIGSTGILKGTGINVGWSNQSWFYPDDMIDFDDPQFWLKNKKYIQDDYFVKYNIFKRIELWDQTIEQIGEYLKLVDKSISTLQDEIKTKDEEIEIIYWVF